MTNVWVLMCVTMLALGAFYAAAETADAASQPTRDPRNIVTGSIIPNESYCDQPYVVITNDGNWLCTLTTGKGHEGQHGQHIVSTTSTDKGESWSDLVDIEPADGPEASWVMPLIVPSGRVYAFYLYNADDVREAKGASGQVFKRVDTLGYYFFKYSDDNGRTWSPERYEVPIREFECDRANVYGGKIRFFWGVGKPIIHDGVAYMGLSKVGALGEGFLEKSEGMFLRSDNIVSEPDPTKICWQTLPEGVIGLRAPEGPIAEEQNLVGLSTGALYCTYRTTDGHPCHAYSHDSGRTWDDVPQYMTYTPGGRLVKHPRAANFVWKCSNGKFLYWFHNHGGRNYNDRNPVWLCGGIEKDGHIHWSQPEILLYDDGPKVRMSYPCLVEQEGKYWVTETQKTVARVHSIDPTLLEGLWSQGLVKEVAQDGLILSLDADACKKGQAPMPELPSLIGEAGFSLDFRVTFADLAAGQVLLDARDSAGKGILVATTDTGTIRIDLNDGATAAGWDCDPDLLKPGTPHHVAVILDGGPRIITFVVDGAVCDGGTARQFGWGRFPRELGDVNGTATVSVSDKLDCLRVYNRAMRNSEAIGNFNAL
jgi:Concanavalin A-like lectin/glucanases superfamily